MIVVVDYGMGNVGSVVNMLRKVGADAVSSGDPAIVAAASKLVLPGVGAFDAAMTRLRERDLLNALNQRVIRDRAPILGICLGMQVMTESSEEGREAGLCWFKGRTTRFRFAEGQPQLRVPHMGWNVVRPTRPTALLAGLNEEPRFYFVHSYHVCCDDTEDVMMITNYGGPFVSGISRDNIFGVQFHPEKSHRFGMSLIRKFASM